MLLTHRVWKSETLAVFLNFSYKWLNVKWVKPQQALRWTDRKGMKANWLCTEIAVSCSFKNTLWHNLRSIDVSRAEVKRSQVWAGVLISGRPRCTPAASTTWSLRSYANLLRSLAACSRNKMPLLRDTADTSLRRAHPSLMIGDGGPSPGRLAVWQATSQLINISAAHHYHHHCVLLPCDVNQPVYVGSERRESSSRAGEDLWCKDFPKGETLNWLLFFIPEETPGSSTARRFLLSVVLTRFYFVHQDSKG